MPLEIHGFSNDKLFSAHYWKTELIHCNWHSD